MTETAVAGPRRNSDERARLIGIAFLEPYAPTTEKVAAASVRPRATIA
jgi:hypothetical protein